MKSLCLVALLAPAVWVSASPNSDLKAARDRQDLAALDYYIAQ